MPANVAPGAETTPILFIHGLGVGLAQYILPLSCIMASPAFASRPIIVPIQPHISQSIWHPHHLKPLGKEKTVRDLKGLVENISGGKGGVDVVSHSKYDVLPSWWWSIIHELFLLVTVGRLSMGGS